MGRICGLAGKDIRDAETYAIIGAAMEVHRSLGPEFLEPAYQAALEVEFETRSIPHDREVEMPIHYKGVPLDVRYRADFVCYGAILVELKAMEKLTTREEAQVINYLAASGIGRGLLFNFGAPTLQFKRFVGPAFLALSNASSVKSVGPGV
jgi:GxxExxY protein